MTQAYTYIAVNVGEIIKWKYTVREIDYSRQIFLSKITIEDFPSPTITSIRQGMFYNATLFLLKANLSRADRSTVLKAFVKGIVKENWEDIVCINKAIKETGHADLLIETNDIIAVDT